MLAIISDLHLTDGTSGSTISPGAFALLSERLTDLAFGASQRRDGGYRPIERVDLLLLGDVLDVIRSSRWLEGRVRPWDDPASPAFVDTVSRITADILRHNQEAMTEFRKLAEQGVAIPDAMRDGRPAARELINIPVRIHYMVGNHDWFFHLPGESYHRIRRQIAGSMGLATPPDAPFPHEAWENNELLQTMRRHKVFARHGDVYDPFNYEGDRNASSLGDVVVIELLNRFGAQVHRELGNDLPESALAGIREIDNIRPLLLVPVWIDGLLERSCPQPAVRKQVKKVWDALADEFLEQPFVRNRDTWCPVDIVDGLQKALKFTRRLSVGWASWVAQWMWQLRGADSSSFYQHALSEQDFRNRRAKHIVYGHTHYAETVPLDASFAEGYVLHQAYFNSGTWRRVYDQTQFAPSEHEFIPADTLTYLAFFKDDERRGRPYETWSGTLGIAPQTPNLLRLDSGAPSDAAGQPISTPSVPLRAPHFAVPLAPLRSPGGTFVS
jgi:UDP-2,3-diacylglucosamine pyrophosphatase LpxH